MKSFFFLALACAFFGSTSNALDVIRNRLISHHWELKNLENTSSRSEKVASHVIHSPDREDMRSGMRVHFHPFPLENGSYLLIRSKQNKKGFKMTQKTLRAYHYTTPYFNGNKIKIDLILKPGARIKRLKIKGIEVPQMVSRRDRSICGKQDDRRPSDQKEIARMVQVKNGGAGCTGTMFGKYCMLSAGHCASYLNVAQFNVPYSDSKGNPAFPPEEDQYPLEKILEYQSDGIGKDWAVYRLKAHPTTGKIPGEFQGHLELSQDPPEVGTQIRITGYGSDNEDENNFAQQTDVGEIVGLSASGLDYVVDTNPGNSGSSVIDEATGKIIGVHTHGGCSASGGSNAGTSLLHHPRFLEMAKKCLADTELRKRRR